jgi:hypothetical protein
LGRDGWEKAAAEMRREHVRREALSEPEKFVEDLAHRWRVSPQFAQSLLEGEDPTPEIRSKVDRSEFRLAKARNYYEALVYDYEQHYPPTRNSIACEFTTRLSRTNLVSM